MTQRRDRLAARSERADEASCVGRLPEQVGVDEPAGQQQPGVVRRIRLRESLVDAHAFGRQIGQQALGGRSDIGILSFYATKLLGGGEGGAVLTNSAEVFDFGVGQDEVIVTVHEQERGFVKLRIGKTDFAFLLDFEAGSFGDELHEILTDATAIIAVILAVPDSAHEEGGEFVVFERLAAP